MLHTSVTTPQGTPAGDELRLLRHCPLCNSTYEPSAVSVIRNGEGAELLHLACVRCGSALLALFVRSGVGMSSIATLTDLSASDAKRLERQTALTDDDVLSFHELLTKEEKIFSGLFIS